jgi:thiamine biosynthesis lipoprotein
MSMHSRRKFFQMAVGAGGMAALSWSWLRGAAWAGDGEAAAPAIPAGLKSARRSSYALGSQIEMTVLHESEEAARKALDAAFGELETVEEAMSVYRPNSDISKLNRDGECKAPHPYFVACMKSAVDMSRRSDGAFDCSVQPLWDLYTAAKKKNALPGDADIDAARKKVDWKKIEISEAKIKLEKGMAVTLNGIAQGFAADRCSDALKKHGVEHALINAGEIGAIGNKGAANPWSVGIQHPRQNDAFIGLANLDGLCLATSGDYATFFSPDFLYNHIFDPATGRSPVAFSSVSIVAANATDADALTKVVFVGGIERGLKLVEQTPKGGAFVVYKDGKTFATKNFPLAN